jgi:tetratricopeptide (TPR) repeat protein
MTSRPSHAGYPPPRGGNFDRLAVTYPDARSRRWHVAIPLLFAAAVRAIYGWSYWREIPYARAPGGDGEVYVDLARQLRQGHWLAPDLLYHSFLYPFFLAAFPFHGDALSLAAIVAQLTLGVLNTWVVMGTAAAIWANPWRTFAAGVGFTLTIPILFFETKLYPETLALTLLIRLFWQMARRSNPWFVGLTCGLLTLVRSEAVLFTPIVLFWAWRVERPGSANGRVVAALMAVVACVALASVRNTLIAGGFVPGPSANSGVTFYQGNNERAQGSFGATGFDASIPGMNRQAKRMAEAALGRPLDPVSVNSYWWRQGLSYLAAAPARAVALAGQKLQIFLGIHELILDLGFYAEREQLPILRLLILPLPALLLLALVGLLSDGRDRPQRVMHLCLAAALFPALIICLVFYAQSRYRVTTLIPALLLAVPGAHGLLKRLRWSPGGLVAGSVLALAVATVVLAQLQTDTPKDRAVSDYNLGIAYERLGADAEALRYFERAFATGAPSVMVRTRYAVSLLHNARADDAEVVLRDGIRLYPASSAPYVVLGNLLFVQRRFAEAEPILRTALRLEPGDEVAKLDVAIMLRLRTSDPGALREAAQSFRELAESDDPRYAHRALVNLGLTYALMGQAAMVDGPYERAAQLQPLSSDQEHDWAIALATVGRYDDARQHLLRALALQPGDPNALRALQALDQRLGSGDRARGGNAD